ncbi:MAG: cell envelope integrity protein TolA, partial [Lysobacterales bacterium]
EQEAREQEEQRRRAEQILLEEEQQRREEEQRQQREREEREAREQAEEAERERIEREQAEQAAREQAEREAEEAAAQAEREAAARQPGAGGSDDSLGARYAAAIQARVNSHWLRPDHVRPGIRCAIRITQIPGGEVISVNVAEPCNADELTRRSIEAAVLRAQPLPYQGFESVFNRNVRFNFRYDGGQ